MRVEDICDSNELSRIQKKYKLPDLKSDQQSANARLLRAYRKIGHISRLRNGQKLGRSIPGPTQDQNAEQNKRISSLLPKRRGSIFEHKPKNHMINFEETSPESLSGDNVGQSTPSAGDKNQNMIKE